MDSPAPDTRSSLILRLPDKQDVEAWDQFASIYQPLVLRLARSKGFQETDAQEIAQEVLIAVSRAVATWDPDPSRGRFRDWLFRIARNLIINYLTRRKHRSIGSGDSAIAELLQRQVNPTAEESNTYCLEYRREVFRWAAERVRKQVKERTWRAFWLTSIHGIAAAAVAKELGMTVGAVHIARSRVFGQLRELVKTFEHEGDAT